MNGYKYIGEGGAQLNIDTSDKGETFLALGKTSAAARPAIEIPPSERIQAAQAIVGDDWSIVPSSEAGPTEIEVVIRSGNTTTRIVQEIEATVGSVVAGGKARELGRAMEWLVNPNSRPVERDATDG